MDCHSDTSIPIYSEESMRTTSASNDYSENYIITDLTSRIQVVNNDASTTNEPIPSEDIFYGMDIPTPSVQKQREYDYEASEPGTSSQYNELDETYEDPIVEHYYMMKDANEDLYKQVAEELEREAALEEEKEAKKEAIFKELEEAIEAAEQRKAALAQRKKQLMMLFKANRERILYCCFICSKAFINEEDVREHVSNTHLAAKQDFAFKCDRCYMRFKMLHHLERHQKTHRDRYLFRCDECNLTFKEKKSLVVHKSGAHNQSLNGTQLTSKKFKCENCNNRFGLQEELKRHQWYCLNKEKILKRREMTKEKTRAEMERSQSVSPAVASTSSCDLPSYNPKCTSTPISCTVPSLSTISPSGRPIKDKSCPYCDLVCASMQTRLKHIQRKHPEMVNAPATVQHKYIKVDSPELPYGCKICNKRVATAASLTIHMRRVHEGKNDYCCETCGKCYPLPSELRKHINAVHRKYYTDDDDEDKPTKHSRTIIPELEEF